MADLNHVRIDEIDSISGVLEGIGGQMFASRPQQLGQEVVYFALRGSGTVEAGGESLPLDETGGAL